MKVKKGLGRGLDALLDTDEAPPAAPAKESLAVLSIDCLQRGKYQPRTRMDEASLAELAASIGQQGLMQPILVRPIGKDRYEIIAGERRWRAARIAGLVEVPVVVREVPDKAALAMALIENIQREDLNALEEAQGLKRLIDEFGLTQEQAAEAVGRSRAAVTNLLRLLNLGRPVQQLMIDGKLEMGHARALLALDARRQEELARDAVELGWSVRETEKRVNELLNLTGKVVIGKTSEPPKVDRDIERYEQELSERFGTRIEVRPERKGSGKLVIRYTNNEHLESLLARFS